MAEYLHPEVRNLAADLDEEELGTIGAECKELYKVDEESCSGWLQDHAKWLNLYYQREKQINPPWEGSSTESLPLLAEGCTQFHARAFQAMFPSRNIVKAIPAGKVDGNAVERAKRISTHLSWQLTIRDLRYKRDKDRLLLSLPLHGSFFTKTYYSPLLKHNVVENVRASDLVCAYGTGPRNIEDVERKTHVIHMTENRSKILAERGYFIKPATPITLEDKNAVDIAHDQAHGITESPRDQTLCKILEQHTFLDLDDDGIAEPYIVHVDHESGDVLRIAIRWETDELGRPTKDRQPVEYFTHYTYIDNPDGFYGLGLGHLVGQANTSANKLIRQLIDAGTLANIGNMSGFISQQLSGVQGGELQMSLGKFVKIPGSVDDMARGIFQFKFPPPGNTIPETLQLIMARADRLATVTEALTGQADKVMQPTTILALIEQGLQVFSSVYERVIHAWTEELGKYYALNYKHMDPEEYFSVLDVDGAMKQVFAAREDYAPDFQVFPIADPRQSTEQQKLTKGQMEWQFLSTNPLVLNSPQHLYNASRRFLETVGTENVDEVLPNPMQMMGLRVDDPYMENMALAQPFPIMTMAFPDQDHGLHIQVHAEAYQKGEMSEMAKTMLRNHLQAHKMMLQNGQGSNQGLAARPDDAMGAGGTGAEVSGVGLAGSPLDGESETGAGPSGGDLMASQPAQPV